MKVALKLIPAVILSFLISCTSTDESAATDAIENPHEIHLNDGAKWVVVPKMMESIRAMEIEINNFNGTRLQEYKDHSKNISELLDELTSNCTMKGDAHDELHKWLLPFIELNEELTKSTSVEMAINLVRKQKVAIQLFNIYFQ